MFIDAHCHLDFEGLIDRLDEVILNAQKAGLKAIVTSGINPATNRQALEIVSRFPNIVKASFGVYPIGASSRDEKLYDVDAELQFLSQNKDRFAIVGECGLDYKTGKDKELMKDGFSKVLEMAKKLNKTVLIHSRKAELDCIEMCQSHGMKKVIMHCFCGRKHLVKKAYDLGFNFTIPTTVVKLQQFQEMVAEVDINHLLCETDSPFLSPFKDKRNEPAFVVESYKKIAEIKGMDIEEVKNNIWMNFQRLF
ncbi:MAG TPA: TatD family hydrolase [Candidatus Nanoarchaeia archaeon]|nr:TatD family hydrolase [Candidatus Nanoarchaeia archaeon]